jgi:uncharacterized small protein (DUF1192 family)
MLATDALQRGLRFLDGLQDQTMTSTASRLATVQRAIEELEAKLTHNQESRAASLKTRIATLQSELTNVEAGDFEVLSGRKAEEVFCKVINLQSA